MAETTPSPSQTPKRTDEILKIAEENLNKIGAITTQIDGLLSKAKESQAKADNEALRANQAKVMVEEHSTAVAKLKGAIEADVAAIATKKTNLDTIAQTMTNLHKSSEADATNIASTRKTAEEAGKAITETSAKTAAILANIDVTKKSIDVTAQTITQNAKNSAAELTSISSNKATANTNLAEIQKTIAATNELYERAKTTHGGIEALEKDSKLKSESMNTLVKKAQDVEKKVAEYELNLSKLQEEFKAELKKVDSLLPIATSTSLASSFCAQKNRFKWPQVLWISSFIGCIFGLLIIAFFGGESLLTVTDQNWDSITRRIVQRLPFVIPLLWLGIYSGRQYMLSLRMQEEYAFKEAVSTAFEGYKREMTSIPGGISGQVPAPINNLCDNVLTTLSRRPGLIYEGKHQDVTPLTPAFDMAEKLANAMGKADSMANIGKK